MPSFNPRAARFYDTEHEVILPRSALENSFFFDLTEEERDSFETFEHYLEACSTASNGVLESIPDELTQRVLWVEISTGELMNRRKRDEILENKYEFDEFTPESEIWEYFFSVQEE